MSLFDGQPEDIYPVRKSQASPVSPEKKQATLPVAPANNSETPSRKWVAKTYRVRADYVVIIKHIAYWQRHSIQDVIDKALTLYIQTIPENEKKGI